MTSGLINDADAFSASVHHGIRDLSLERLAIATQFQHAVPSLTHIFLTSRGVMLQSDKKLQEVWNVSKAWRVLSEESFGRHIEEMSFNDAEAVLNMEDMQTAVDWKVRMFTCHSSITLIFNAGFIRTRRTRCRSEDGVDRTCLVIQSP